MAAMSTKRLGKELNSLQNAKLDGIRLLNADDLKTWTLEIEVLGESIYKVTLNIDLQESTQ